MAQQPLAKHHHHAGFGEPDIGIVGSLFLITNNIIGPAMLQLPGVFQTSGWIPSILAMALCAVWTVMAGKLLSRAMALFPGNATFTSRLEFGKIAYNLLPLWMYYLTSASLVFMFFTQNLANILVTAQTMDNMILASAGKTCAFVMDVGAANRFVCISGDKADNSSDSLFGTSTVFTLGYAVTLVVAIPLGMLNLDDNIIIQVAGMLLTFLCVFVWVFNFISMGLTPSFMPAFASDGSTGYLQLLPAILFNYGFVVTIPSWINEKRKDVRVGYTLVGAQALASVQYLLVAVFAGLAMDFTDGVDITARLNDPAQQDVWLASRIMTFIFPLANILTSIPVFSIIIRYNLLQLEGLKMPVWVANAIAVVSPWVVAVPLYSGNQVNDLITWASAILFAFMNLIVPLAMHVSAEAKAAAGTLVLPREEDNDDGDNDAVARVRRGSSGDDSEAAGGEGDVLMTPIPAHKRGGLGLGEGSSESVGGAGAHPAAPATDVRGNLLSLLSDPTRLRVKLMAPAEGARGEGYHLGEGLLSGSHDGEVSGEEALYSEDIHAIPAWARAMVSEVTFSKGLLGVSVVTAIVAFVLQVWSQVNNPPSS